MATGVPSRQGAEPPSDKRSALHHGRQADTGEDGDPEAQKQCDGNRGAAGGPPPANTSIFGGLGGQRPPADSPQVAAVEVEVTT
jgi:hypothetical protein